MPSPNGSDPGAGDSGAGSGAGRDDEAGGEPRARAAAARGLRGLAAALVVLLVALAGAYAAWPWLAAAAAAPLAARLGLDDLHLAVARPGLDRLAVDRVELTSGRLRVTASGGTLRYRPSSLVRGHVIEAVFRHVVVDVMPPARAAAPPAAGGDTRTGSAGQPDRDSPAPFGPPDVANLFASLPADRVAVQTLEVRVPAVDFRAAGDLVATPERLDVRLDGLAPPRAERFALTLGLTPDAKLQVRVAERGAPPPAVLLARSSLSGGRLELTGELELEGFPLDLAAGLAGLEPGDGRVTGSFSGVLPWPPQRTPEPPEDSAGPDAAERLATEAAEAEGRFDVEFRPAAGTWSVRDAAVDWRFAGGTLSGTMRGSVRYLGSAVDVRLRADTLDPAGTAGRGELELVRSGAAAGSDAAGAGREPDAPSGDSPGAPRLALTWELAPERLTVAGTFRASEALWQWLQGESAQAPGRGVLSGRLELTVPRPFPDRLQELEPVGEGTLEGRWQFLDWPLEVRGIGASWRTGEGRLTGTLQGDIVHEKLTVPTAVELDGLALDGSVLAARGRVSLGRKVRVPFSVEHDTAAGAGRLTAQTAVAVDAPLFASIAEGWRDRFDVLAGQIGLEAALGWPAEAGVAGTLVATLDAVDARYETYTLSGLRGRLRLAAAETGGWSLAPADVAVASVDTGVVLSDVTSRIAWFGDYLTVDGVRARLLGGTAEIAPFAYELGAGDATFVIDVAGVELGQVLALEGEHLSGTGVLRAMLPVHVRGGAPGVDSGQVRAEPPGGVIRVSPALAGGTGQPGLDFALRALQDFRYRSLEADVVYTGAGDLSLAVRLEGSNPAIQDGRPIRYNLTVTENLPTLLKSLRLQDDLTREIERRIRE